MITHRSVQWVCYHLKHFTPSLLAHSLSLLIRKSWSGWLLLRETNTLVRDVLHSFLQVVLLLRDSEGHLFGHPLILHLPLEAHGSLYYKTVSSLLPEPLAHLQWTLCFTEAKVREMVVSWSSLLLVPLLLGKVLLSLFLWVILFWMSSPAKYRVKGQTEARWPHHCIICWSSHSSTAQCGGHWSVVYAIALSLTYLLSG